MEIYQVTMEQLGDGTYRATFEDLFSMSGFGDTKWEALTNMVEWLEASLSEEINNE